MAYINKRGGTMKRLDLLLVLGMLALIYALTTDAGGPPCEPFARFERNQGSLSLFPERVTTQFGEEVTLLNCGGSVRVEIHSFEEYNPQRRK
jgi:hypothetical protein